SFHPRPPVTTSESRGDDRSVADARAAVVGTRPFLALDRRPPAPRSGQLCRGQSPTDTVFRSRPVRRRARDSCPRIRGSSRQSCRMFDHEPPRTARTERLFVLPVTLTPPATKLTNQALWGLLT